MGFPHLTDIILPFADPSKWIYIYGESTMPEQIFLAFFLNTLWLSSLPTFALTGSWNKNALHILSVISSFELFLHVKVALNVASPMK